MHGLRLAVVALQFVNEGLAAKVAFGAGKNVTQTQVQGEHGLTRTLPGANRHRANQLKGPDTALAPEREALGYSPPATSNRRESPSAYGCGYFARVSVVWPNIENANARILAPARIWHSAP